MGKKSVKRGTQQANAEQEGQMNKALVQSGPAIENSAPEEASDVVAEHTVEEVGEYPGKQFLESIQRMPDLEPPHIPLLFELSNEDLSRKAAAAWNSSFQILDMVRCSDVFGESDAVSKAVLKEGYKTLLTAALRAIDRLVKVQSEEESESQRLTELTNVHWASFVENLKQLGTEYRPYDSQPNLDEWLLKHDVCARIPQGFEEVNVFVHCALGSGFNHVNKVLSWMGWVGAILLDRHRRAKIVPADNVHEKLASLHEKTIALCLESRLLYDAHHIEYTGTLNYVPSFAKWFGDKHRALKEGVKTLEEGLLALDPPPVKHIAMTNDLLTLEQEVVTQNGVDYPFTSEGKDGLIARCRRDLQTEAKAWRPTAATEIALPKAEKPIWHENEMKLYFKDKLVADLKSRRDSKLHFFIEVLQDKGWPPEIEFRGAWPEDPYVRSNKAAAINRSIQGIRFGYGRMNPDSLTWVETKPRNKAQ